MNIAYCTNVRLPTERAYGHQISQVCNALVELGHSVHVFAPFRNNPITESFNAYHNVHTHTQIQYLGTKDYISSPWLPGISGLLVQNYTLRKRYRQLDLHTYDILYTRAEALLPSLLAHNVPVILELHHVPTRNLKHFVQHCNQCQAVVCLTSGIRTALEDLGVDPKKLVVEPDAVETSWLTEHVPTLNRGDVPLPNDAYIFGYTGQLFTKGLSKGVDVLLEAFSKLPTDLHTHLLIVGGSTQDWHTLSAQYTPEVLERTTHVPFVQRNQVRDYQLLCDCLVYPAPQSNHPYFMRDTSPLKLFEYLTTKKPIICADLPPIHDVLSSAEVDFFEPGNASSLAKSMLSVIKNPQAQQKTRAAFTKAQLYTWPKRMERILSLIH